MVSALISGYSDLSSSPQVLTENVRLPSSTLHFYSLGVFHPLAPKLLDLYMTILGLLCFEHLPAIQGISINIAEVR